ncbi:hypothetical protein O181_073078 [Austropuccinia psidii MF-1]|uniref:Uncharacterized protein n=1 Tax=Austropuccinia psidii MF-1 TaxID=1389203 RepID=A0A9Q3I9Q8_9BASI|nr:hypothetical protein [Austropuccinia psidii MF-1]
MLTCMRLKQMHADWPQVSAHKWSSFCTTEHFNYDPKADLRNGLTQAHTVFTCHTAAQTFVQTLSPGHKAATNACDACQQAHKKCLFVVQPLQPRSQRSSQPRHPCEDSFVVGDDESIPEWEWTPGPQMGRQEQLWTISPVPSSIDLSTPLLGHDPMVTSLLNRSEVIFRLMKDGNGKRTFELGPIVTMSCHPWDSKAKVKQKQPNPPQQDSPVPSLPRKQTPWQPTPGPSGTQWSEDFFREPSQTNEPPIPGPSPSSKPHEDVPTCEPEPEVALMQAMEEPFDPPLVFPLHPLLPQFLPRRSLPLPPRAQPPLPPSGKLPSFPQ